MFGPSEANTTWLISASLHVFVDAEIKKRLSLFVRVLTCYVCTCAPSQMESCGCTLRWKQPSRGEDVYFINAQYDLSGCTPLSGLLLNLKIALHSFLHRRCEQVERGRLHRGILRFQVHFVWSKSVCISIFIVLFSLFARSKR